MIHEVILAVDQGKPLITQEVPIHQGDTLETLKDRIHVGDLQLIFWIFLRNSPIEQLEWS